MWPSLQLRWKNICITICVNGEHLYREFSGAPISSFRWEHHHQMRKSRKTICRTCAVPKVSQPCRNSLPFHLSLPSPPLILPSGVNVCGCTFFLFPPISKSVKFVRIKGHESPNPSFDGQDSAAQQPPAQHYVICSSQETTPKVRPPSALFYLFL